MSAVTTNILCGNLVISDIISIFESANGMNSFESSQNIFYTADKAAIPGNDSTQVDSAVCQNTKGIVAYSLLYRLQNLFPMANGKILTATANHSTRMSTANARNSVSRRSYNRIKSQLDNLDSFIHEQGLKPLSEVYSSARKPAVNLYLYSVIKAFSEFLHESADGYLCAIDGLESKIKAAAKLFPEDRRDLKSTISKNK